MAEDGYSTAIIFWRYFSQTLYQGGSAVRNCIAALCEMIHQHGMKCMLDTDPCFWGPAFGERFPEAQQWLYKCEHVTVHADGRFRFTSKRPTFMTVWNNNAHVVFRALELYTRTADGDYRHLRKDEFECAHQNFHDGYEICGKLKDTKCRQLVCFVASSTSALPDLTAPEYLKAQEEMLDDLASIPLDGFGWDEPAKGSGSLAFFKAGRSFLDFFRAHFNYDLLDVLPYLSEEDDSPKAVRVRLDYFEALTRMNYEAQRKHNDYAEKLAGHKLLFGTHQTWSGLPCDLAGGVTDYFRLGNVLTAAWTDGSWECDMRSISLHIMLADSIRNGLKLDDAYYNDWGFTLPIIEDMHFATRFKMLYHINWFNIFFSESSEGICNWKLEPAHSAHVKDLQALDQFNDFLAGMRTSPRVAVLYDCASLAAAPKWLVRHQYTSLGNTCQTLIDGNITANLITGDELAAGKVIDGKLCCGARKFEAVVLPNCYTLTAEAYTALKEITTSGVAVVVYGVPPMYTTDGACIQADFAAQVGIEKLTLAELSAGYAENEPLPVPDEWELERYDARCPVTLNGAIASYNAEGQVVCVQSPDSALHYMPLADPREDLLALLRTLLPEEETRVFAENAYYTTYASADGCDHVVVFAAHGRIADTSLFSCRISYHDRLARRKRHSFKAMMKTAGGEEITITNGTWCALRFHDGKLTASIGDSTVING